VPNIKNHKIAVYDFGGGTFDISVLEVGADLVEVKSTDGDAHMGGEDIDREIVKWIGDEFKKESGSYEALFSKKAQLYKSMDLKNQSLTEADFKKYILEHYTFLSRPVFIINDKIYIGNSQQNIHQVHLALAHV
jgi:arsenate reductase